MITLHHGDCREVIPTLGVTVDAVVTDPPYGLEFMGVAWDSFKDRPKGRARTRNEWGDFGSREHARGQDDIARVTRNKAAAFEMFSREWAEIVFSALKPGGYLIAFGGTRTYHRMTVAIEDAGFIIQDCLMWLYATGFPKNKAHLKPAYEPLVLAYKPGGKRTMQVDECRVGTNGESFGNADAYATRSKAKGDGWVRPHHGGDNDTARAAEAIRKAETLGRWPANICHDGSDEVVGLFPTTGPSSGLPRNNGAFKSVAKGEEKPRLGLSVHEDAGGSAARFFFSAKAGAQDRWGSRHPTVKPVELMKWLVALVTPPGGTVLDPFAGSGTTAVAAMVAGRNAILIEREEQYVADIRERLAFYEGGGQHSTQARNRHRKVDHGPLFALTPEEDAADSLASYNVAVQAIGEAVKAGGPVPEFMRSRKSMT